MSEHAHRSIRGWIRTSVTFKLILIAAIILALLIPASMMTGLVRERKSRRDAVISDVSAKWGASQTVTGPVLSVPFSVKMEDDKGKIHLVEKRLHFLPDEIGIEGDLSTQERYRGIYRTILYGATLSIRGTFPNPMLEEIDASVEDVEWDRAFVSLGISDMKGIREEIVAVVGDGPVEMDPGIPVREVISSGVSARVPLRREAEGVPFEFTLELNGSRQVQFVPVGKVTSVRLRSAWPHPSFNGEYLPVARTITETGFEADWKVLHLNRNYPQSWVGDAHSLAGSGFGVELFIPVDVYQKTMRTLKYAVMFLGFTFMVLFFSEIMNGRPIHPLQYLLIGFAVSIFYALLLSIAEFFGFGAAYLISSAVILALIGAYTNSVTGNRRATFLVSGVLGLLYGYLYLVLQMADYALLMGSVGLLAALAAVMYLTRGIDWYAIRLEEASSSIEEPS
ncbi:cell envelope integrity protein CreD [Candidatus Poribacteria bacterium]|jgi:inner membrane protein|nr:cell envelope integrity protein CreD [Candidatus Poribacteria bacterium]MBT5532419.1 cell envelope integrity protein CreD [Candidatus Poribacteria bacterium]MBT5711952.1 cell envelope integrity protein CreD [Candidatus Poribacteria bacterium]MBT7099726.1 cell envelope integrity protein CreD [Candidatus Poribacteria bacterium]MBT7807682.1 cell envelope integrity protein CreD [Candidatus Poribacteria bacterium]